MAPNRRKREFDRNTMMIAAVDAKVGFSFMALILLGILLGLVVLLVWKHRRAGIYIGIGLGLVVLVSLLLWGLAGVRQSERYEAEAQLEEIRQEKAARRDSFSSVEPFWQVTVENEFEADNYAVRLMNSAGFDPQASKSVLTKLAASPPDDIPIYNYFLSHPSVKKRIEKIDIELGKLEK